MVMTEDNLYFLASKKKIDFLKQVNRELLIPISRTTEGKSLYYGRVFFQIESVGGKDTGVNIKLLVRDKGDNDKKNFGILNDAIKSSRGGKNLGVVAKDLEKFPGPFMTAFRFVCLIFWRTFERHTEVTIG